MTRRAGHALTPKDLVPWLDIDASQRMVHGLLLWRIISLRATNDARSEQRLAQVSKYRLAIELIAACYGWLLTSKAACSMASNYRNRSRQAFIF
jgi:hypothetical protein